MYGFENQIGAAIIAGTALSYGVVGARSATFAGITVNYGQATSARWFWGAALAWDNEKSKADPPPDATDRGKIDKRVNLSVSLEYNLSQSEPDVSFDLGYGVSF